VPAPASHLAVEGTRSVIPASRRSENAAIPWLVTGSAAQKAPSPDFSLRLKEKAGGNCRASEWKPSRRRNTLPPVRFAPRRSHSGYQRPTHHRTRRLRSGRSPSVQRERICHSAPLLPLAAQRDLELPLDPSHPLSTVARANLRRQMARK
jgi:hypothetical protein